MEINVEGKLAEIKKQLGDEFRVYYNAYRNDIVLSLSLDCECRIDSIILKNGYNIREIIQCYRDKMLKNLRAEVLSLCEKYDIQGD